MAGHARSERVLVELALQPALAFQLALPHILLARLGYPDADCDALLRSCIASNAAHGRDRSASASLEWRWAYTCWTGRAPIGARLGGPSASALNRPLDLLNGRREDAYAFTHLLFYATDFGFREPHLPRRRATILGEAAALLARYLDAEDYDLAGELLLAWPMTRATWSSAAAFGFRVLAAIEDRVGVLPCGNVDHARLARLAGEQRGRYALGTAYHTAYVMGLLAAAALRPGRAPPVTITGPRIAPAGLDRLLSYVRTDQGHWQAEFGKLSAPEQQALAAFIFDVAIVQNSRRHDYQAVSELLSLARECALDTTPMCRQAAELLLRIANCSTALSARSNRHHPAALATA